MTTPLYAAFLRGINVGSIRIKMPDLKACFEGLGLGRVSTYQQTGNVLFSSPLPLVDLKARIEAALSATFGYEAYVLLVEAASLPTVVSSYPFPRDGDHHAYAIFVGDSAVLADLEAQGQATGEPVQAGEGVLYWRTPKGHTLDTPFAKTLGKARYKATTTNRNLNTLELMLETILEDTRDH